MPGVSAIGMRATLDSSSVMSPVKPGSMNPAVEWIMSPMLPMEDLPSSRPAGAQHVGVVDAVAPSQRRRHQSHHLVAGMGSARRVAQVEMPVNQLWWAQVQGQRGGKDQASIVDQAVVVEGDLDAAGVVIW